MASQAELLFGVLGYFTVLTLLLQMIGSAGPGVSICPSGSTICQATSPSSPNHLAFQATSGVLCAGSIGLAFFTVGLSLVAGAFTCGTFLWSIFAPSSAIDAFHYIFDFISIFFQVLTFQLPIPTWLNAIIVLPAAAVMIYIGIRALRGGG